MVRIPLAAVAEVMLERFDPVQRGSAVWMGIGALSTISHGLLLIVTFPVWLVGGTVALVAGSHQGVTTLSDRPERGASLKEVATRQAELLRSYSRWPQGLPPGREALPLQLEQTPIAAAPPATFR